MQGRRGWLVLMTNISVVREKWRIILPQQWVLRLKTATNRTRSIVNVTAFANIRQRHPHQRRLGWRLISALLASRLSVKLGEKFPRKLLRQAASPSVAMATRPTKDAKWTLHLDDRYETEGDEPCASSLTALQVHTDVPPKLSPLKRHYSANRDALFRRTETVRAAHSLARTSRLLATNTC